uniref:Uncharacterized protein n=1 Tax=viral metagenome TaxID=1070528 RepID=A0A6M3J3U5_9ZZZZ
MEVTAKSGSWKDIQDAVDQFPPGGTGILHIPEGVWNFADEPPWHTVVIPSTIKIHILGVMMSPSDIDATTGIPKEGTWKTMLVMPFHAPYQFFFSVTGDGQHSQSPSTPNIRIAYIKFVGYREFNHRQEGITEPNSWGYAGIQLNNIKDFRIDHCYFRHVTDWCISIYHACGVIDHNRFINRYGSWTWNSSMPPCGVGYGIGPMNNDAPWNPDISQVIGNYNDYTIFIDHNYFSRWRHDTVSQRGTHYVFRFNIIEHDSGSGNVDAHGYETGATLSTRAMEIYGNKFLDLVANMEGYQETDPSVDPWTNDTVLANYAMPNTGICNTVNWRGGGGVYFNNYVRNYGMGPVLIRNGIIAEQWAKDIWIWNNKNEVTELGFPQTIPINPNSAVAGLDYAYLGEGQEPPYIVNPDGRKTYMLPALGEDNSVIYTPYPDPHPLTVSLTEKFTPFSEAFEEGTYQIIIPATVIDEEKTYKFIQWEDGSTNPIRIINLVTDMNLQVIYELLAVQLVTISGTFIDAETSVPVEGVRITSGIYEAISDASGAFILQIPSGAYILIITKEGYDPLQITINATENLTLEPIEIISVAGDSPLPWILVLVAIAAILG